jgi:hypothetical protein
MVHANKLLGVAMEQTPMLVGCAIALVPLGLVVLCLVVLGIVGAMRCYQRWMLAN